MTPVMRRLAAALGAVTLLAMADVGAAGTATAATACKPQLFVANHGEAEVKEATPVAHVLFDVSVAGCLGSPVTVAYHTEDHAPGLSWAVQVHDYVPASDVLTWTGFDRTTVHRVSVQVQDDTDFESEEAFFLVLGDGTGAGVPRAMGVIEDNDNPFATGLEHWVPPTQPYCHRAGVCAVGFGTPTAHRGATTLTLALSDGTAVDGRDYDGASLRTITVPAGATRAEAPVRILPGARTSWFLARITAVSVGGEPVRQVSTYPALVTVDASAPTGSSAVR